MSENTAYTISYDTYPTPADEYQIARVVRSFDFRNRVEGLFNVTVYSV